MDRKLPVFLEYPVGGHFFQIKSSEKVRKYVKSRENNGFLDK